MASRKEVERPGAEAAVPSLRLRHGLRFSPHVIVLLATLLAAIPPLRGTLVSAVHWWWDDSYANVGYVMDDARPNDGHPYIAGHLDGSTEQRNLVAAMQGSTIVTKAPPQQAFEAGKRIAIWHSPHAPNLLVFGAETNDVPVASLPRRPGGFALLGYLAWLAVTWIIGIGLMAWVRHRWSRSYGDLPMQRRGGSAL